MTSREALKAFNSGRNLYEPITLPVSGVEFLVKRMTGGERYRAARFGSNKGDLLLDAYTIAVVGICTYESEGKRAWDIEVPEDRQEISDMDPADLDALSALAHHISGLDAEGKEEGKGSSTEAPAPSLNSPAALASGLVVVPAA